MIHGQGSAGERHLGIHLGVGELSLFSFCLSVQVSPKDAWSSSCRTVCHPPVFVCVAKQINSHFHSMSFLLLGTQQETPIYKTAEHSQLELELVETMLWIYKIFCRVVNSGKKKSQNTQKALAKFPFNLHISLCHLSVGVQYPLTSLKHVKIDYFMSVKHPDTIMMPAEGTLPRKLIILYSEQALNSAQ